jgi:uncharacterized protein YbcV (DUF1398 family)
MHCASAGLRKRYILIQENMLIEEQIQDAYKVASGYPDLVMKLITIGVQSYTVDVATGIILYRFEGGRHVIHQQNRVARIVAEEFNHELTVQAVRDTQQDKTDYPAFMDAIAKAGIRFYEATFTGNLRVTYIGVDGVYEEEIPV